ncbi:MAG: GNAT family N-acetyltransferase [Candidatus Eremiobacteraeota bacterium]|nr:GNAT family N-acetyltransferase [Candidatus Eremiobacteraeota bacterium]
MSVSFNLEELEFEQISPARDLGAFKCAETSDSKEIESFLKEYALFYHKQGLTRVALALHKDIIAGYFALSMGGISLSHENREEIFGPGVKIRIPALLLARMGVHEEYRGNGIGRAMMMHVYSIAYRLSDIVGFRFVFVDSKAQSVDFYASSTVTFLKALVHA